jgi:hypothetical protein
MPLEPVQSMRTAIRDEPEGLTFLIPARRLWFAMFFIPIWLVGWAAGEVGVGGTLLEESGGELLFTVVWLSFWTAGGVVAILLWLWMLAGRVRVVLADDRLRIRYELFGLGRSREYGLADVRDLRVAPESLNLWSWSAGLRWWGFGGGVVAFDYGPKTVRFGAGIDEAEGKQLVRRILERHPIPRTD